MKHNTKKLAGALIACIGIAIMLCIEGNPECGEQAFIYELIAKLIGLAMFVGGAWLGDLFKDTEEEKSKIRIAHDDGEYKMPEE